MRNLLHLPLVLVEPFTHANEESISIDRNPQSLLDIRSKSSFVRVLDRSPLLLEIWIIRILSESLQFEEIVEPVVIPKARSDESSERRVALEQPAT